MKTKSEVRKEVLKLRNAMPDQEVEEKSNAISIKLESLREFRDSNAVFVYMDFKNEVRTIALIKKIMSEGKRVIIPYTDIVNTVIVPVELHDMNEDLNLSFFGYLEPKKEKIIPVSPDEFDIIIVPGVAFDKRLNRVGFGKGYYDRILSGRKQGVKAIALCYEYQVLEEVAYEAHDIRMDMIITESNIYI